MANMPKQAARNFMPDGSALYGQSRILYPLFAWEWSRQMTNTIIFKTKKPLRTATA
jgi:hypothetical protein